MSDRLSDAPCSDPAAVAERLEHERRLDALGAGLTTLRVFLVVAVQAYLLLGFSFLFVRPPSPAFYAALFALLVNTILFTACLLRFFRIRRKMFSLIATL